MEARVKVAIEPDTVYELTLRRAALPPLGVTCTFHALLAALALELVSMFSLKVTVRTLPFTRAPVTVGAVLSMAILAAWV